MSAFAHITRLISLYNCVATQQRFIFNCCSPFVFFPLPFSPPPKESYKSAPVWMRARARIDWNVVLWLLVLLVGIVFFVDRRSHTSVDVNEILFSVYQQQTLETAELFLCRPPRLHIFQDDCFGILDEMSTRRFFSSIATLSADLLHNGILTWVVQSMINRLGLSPLLVLVKTTFGSTDFMVIASC